MNRREERNRRLVVFLLAAPSAAIVWFVFHTVYQNLSASVRAVGYVDPMTQMGIALGYVVMVAGTVILGAVSLWAAAGYLRLLGKP